MGAVCPEKIPAQIRVPVKIGIGNRQVEVKAILDTGNLLTNGIAVSAGFARQYRLPYTPCTFNVGTAKRGNPLTVVGKLGDIRLQIGDKCIHRQTALVVDSLSTQVNIGIALLTAVQAKLHLTPEKNELEIGRSRIPLIQSVGPMDAKEPGKSGQDTRLNMETVSRAAATTVNRGEDMSEQWPALQRPGTVRRPAVEPGQASRPVRQGPTTSDETTQLRPVSRKIPDVSTAPAEQHRGVTLQRGTSLRGEKQRERAMHPRGSRATSTPLKSVSKGKFSRRVANKRFFVKNEYTHLGQAKKVKHSRPEPPVVHPREGRGRWGAVQSVAENVCLKPSQSMSISPHQLVFVDLMLESSIGYNGKYLINSQLFRNTAVNVLPGCYRGQQGRVRVAVVNLTEDNQLLPRSAGILADRCHATPAHQAEIEDMLRESMCQKYGSQEVARDEQPATGIQNIKVECSPDNSKGSSNEGQRMKQLFTELKLEESSILRMHPKIKRKLQDQLYRLRDVFSNEGDDIGQTDVVQCTVKLKSGTVPVRQKNRPLNPAMEEDLRKQLQQWLDKGIVEPSKSPWSSPLVPVRKKDGAIRWAVDLRLVNQCVVGDSYPLPRIEQLLETSGGHRIYSSLDASAAYHTIPMADDAKEITAFSTPDGLFHYCKMPFGLSTAPAVYSRFIAIVLSPLGTRGLSVYLDDVLVYSNKPEEHLDRLVQVLEAHQAAGIKIKPAKTRLFQESTQYLGHVLSKDGIAMIPSYVESIVNWPSPTTSKQLTTLLGFTGYYRQFLKNYAQLVAPLTKQKRKPKLDWTEECEENFQELKKQFQAAPIRAVPVYDGVHPFKLTTDYSGQAIAAVLSQLQNGQERLIAAVGRRTTKGESNYSSAKGEISAVVYGIRKFHHILSFAKFQIITDSAALKYLHTLKNTRGITGRWLQELAGYQFEVHHRAGKINNNADSLSRAEHLKPPSEEEEQEQADYVFQIEETPITQTLSRLAIKEAQDQDGLCQLAKQWVLAGRKPELKELRGSTMEVYVLRQQFEQLRLASDQVLVIDRPENNLDTLQEKIVLPESLHGRAFFLTHQHATAGHFGQRATLARQRRNFYYPGQAADIENRVKLCETCIQKNPRLHLKDVQHQPHRWGYPLEMLFVDLVGPLPKSTDGFQYILTVQDAYSRFLNLYPIRSKTSAEVTRTLVDRFVGNFGCPTAIHSDNGTEFTSAVWSGLMKALEIKVIHGPPYNCQSNSVERAHRTLHAVMRTCMAREDMEWPRFLPTIQLAFNSKVNTSTGVTPLLAFTGREVRLPIDLMVSLPGKPTNTVPEEVRDITTRMKKMYSYIRQRGEAVIRRNAALYSGRRNEYQVGELIWYLCPRAVPGKPLKWTQQWTGPFRITQVVSEVLIKIRAIAGLDRELTVHLSRIRPYVGLVNPSTRVPATLEVNPHSPVEADEIHGNEFVQTPIEMGIPVRNIPEGNITIREVDETPPAQPIPGGTAPPSPEESSRQSMEKPPIPGVEATDNYQRQRLPDEDSEMATPQASWVEDEMVADNEEEVNQPAGLPQSPPAGSMPSERPRTQAVTRKHSTTEATTSEESSSPELRRWASNSTVKKKIKKKRIDIPVRDLLYDSADSSSETMLQMITVPIRCSHYTPARPTELSAGFEMKSGQHTVIPAGTATTVDTGLQVMVPEQYFGKTEANAELSQQGLICHSSIISPRQSEQIKIILQNITPHPISLKKGTRIAQLILLPRVQAECCQEDQLPATQRADWSAHQE